MVLVCNNQAAAGALLDELEANVDPVAQARLVQMHGVRPGPSYGELCVNEKRLRIVAELTGLELAPARDDDDILS